MKELFTALLPSVISLCGIIITAIITNSLIKYRVGELEKKVEKHNTLIERMFVVETEVKDIKERIK